MLEGGWISRRMMKKRIVLIIVIVLPVILYLIAVYAVPIGRFKNQTKEFDQFVTEVKEESLTRKHVRVEMSTEEYARVKSEIFQSGLMQRNRRNNRSRDVF